MKYGYARVSTFRQGAAGSGLDDQRARLSAAGAEEIICERFTGARMDRPAFTALLNRLVPGDALLVTKLDRFARTAAEGSQLVRDLVARGVTVEILNMGRADASPMGRLMVTILLAFAEYERDMIIERTQAGKAVAREKGVRVDGRPRKFPPAQMNHAMSLLADNSYNRVAEMTGISRSTLMRERRRREREGMQLSTQRQT